MNAYDYSEKATLELATVKLHKKQLTIEKRAIISLKVILTPTLFDFEQRKHHIGGVNIVRMGKSFGNKIKSTPNVTFQT